MPSRTRARGGASSEAARWLAARENAALLGGVSLENKDDDLARVLLDLSQTGTLEASYDVAGKVLGALDRVAHLHGRRVERAGFLVLKSPDVPSILVETGFISNPNEERKLRSAAHRDRIARAVMDGIRGYFARNPPPGTLLALREHVIERGDTLSEIAARYSVSLKRLRIVNHLDSDLLRVGQVLRIPTGGQDG
jgi:N-acetylmuramoyl-L-alanine amidase